MKLDPRMRGRFPHVDKPVAFVSPDGRIKGWKVAIPGGRPLATPAVVGGRVFLGGGFGSYDFYALDAQAGEVVWQYQTTDDGPTAAVVSEGFVAFNTESCELEILTVQGRSVWKKWLGDPLMSMPAIEGGRVFQAYPYSRGDRQHFLGGFDLRTGRELWKQPINGEVITAPVLADGQVFLATLDGAMACFRQDDGTPVWHEAKNATSSPVVWKGQCYFSQRKEVPLDVAGKQGWQQMEHLAAKLAAGGGETRHYNQTASAADWLDHAKRKMRSPMYAASEECDGAVGFAGFKGDAKIGMAMKNLGQGHVHGVWAYQGSKPFLARGRLYSGLGAAVHCADPFTDRVFWKRTVHEAKAERELLDCVLTPPAVVNGKLFLGTIHGDVCCLSAETGERLWNVHLGEPVIFQPAVAGGRVYAATNAGSLYCLETGDAGDDGWLMWGATAAHNGLPDGN